MPAQAKFGPNEPTVHLFATRATLLMMLGCFLLLPCPLAVVVGISEEGTTPNNNKPLVARVSLKTATRPSLHHLHYQESNGVPLVVDLPGVLVWPTCPTSSTRAVQPTSSGTRTAAGTWTLTGCFWANREPVIHGLQGGCACTTHPFNSGECSTDDLTAISMSANTTNGTVPLAQRPVDDTAMGACAPC
jgi:hypothetical protein